MCGICGLFDASRPAEHSRELLERMNARLVHRGPDDGGVHTSGPCGLGHRRLKVVDLSPLGSQPMANNDESIWISFNGEIYNFVQLRHELMSRGHSFRGQSDTEVLLRLYEEQGPDFLSTVNGMFALAIWDRRRRRLLLARDRMGKKPLYYFHDGRRLLFGSELKAILADPSVPRDLDPEALASYLTLGYIPAPATIFRGIRKLPAASYLVVEADELGEARVDGPHRFWTLQYEPNHSLTESQCVEQVRALIDDAVRTRMYSDVPLGAFLSGGIDSATIVAHMQTSSAVPVQTFSIGFDDDDFDELPWAQQIADTFGTQHRTFRCTADVLEVLPILVKHYDEPFADASAVPTYYLAKLARESVTVALAGDGGDEVFAGYPRYDTALRNERRAASMRGRLTRVASRALAGVYPTDARGWGILYRHSHQPLDAFLSDLCCFVTPALRSFLEPRLAAAADGSALRTARRAALQHGGDDLLSRVQYIDQTLGLADDILVKVDRASMAVSLEVREPLLDYRLVEFMATVPSALRYRGATPKYLLKQAMAGILPNEVLHRAKMGFGVPIRRWFRGRAAGYAAEVLLDPRTQRRGFFRAGQVERLLDEHRRGPRDMSGKIWELLFFELWCREWLDDVPAPLT